ncbi:hypothetical protein BKA66DRAFT_514650 [Pyrenochaeta sp. MPI-SDFR-AT-0127]|nr:hypothetical protein BKA66DRAFT_514650 [Pyrenochaeta sp. MPI-SDFR-AT-0127]
MATSKTNLNILISGSGIAGPCLAFWLHKFLPSSQITILERAAVPRIGGQAVDLRSASVPIVERMGLLEKVREMTTTELGMEFVYADGVRKASFPMTGNAEQQSMTSEFEILRGDMAKLLYEATKDLPNIKYVFDEMITVVEEKESGKVEVTFKNHLPVSEFDVVVGADGMMSRTRRLVFGHGPKNDDYLYRLGQYAALFTIPRIDEDTKFAQWYNAPKGRLFLLRPDQYGTTRAYLAVTDSNLSRFDEIDKLLKEGTRQQQEAWFEKEFEGAGWQTERVVEGMKKSDDYYMQQIAQVKMDTWVKGHVALVGDAAWCPSPISGVGTGSAIVGAYVLAGELSRNPTNIPLALSNFEKVARPFINKVQKLVPGTPQIANPQTEWGITIFNTVTGMMAHPLTKRLGGLFGGLVPAFGSTSVWSPPDYEKAEV